MSQVVNKVVPYPSKPLCSRVVPGARRWTSCIGAALEARTLLRAARLDDLPYWIEHTRSIQIAQLRRNITKAARTEFGRTHDFARIARLRSDDAMLDAYRSSVPVADWYVYADLLGRMRTNGEPDLLWPGVVEDFAQTSGTTAGDKYIPVSKDMFRSNYRASLDIFANFQRLGISLTDLMAGKCLFIGGSSDVDVNRAGIRTGDLSGLVTSLITWPLSEIYLPGRDIALMSDWTAKIEAMARAIWNQDVRFVSGMPSWALVLFRRVIEIANEHGCEARTLADLWPNLRVLVHGGVKFAPFEPRVRELWSGSPVGADVPNRFELYPASEGFIAMQDGPLVEGAPTPLRLIPDIGNFYEFVPIEQIDDPDPHAFTADQVEIGQRYVVVMSTCAGLWRYILGDVVVFDSVPRPGRSGTGIGPARLRIVGRHRHFINAFGENLIVEHIEQAASKAAHATGLTMGEFTAAPVYPGPAVRAGLELAVEFTGTPTSEQLDAFARVVDESLKAVNVDYAIKRKDDLWMVLPTITPMPMGTFHRWLASRGKLGGQHKCPRCANHREIIESVKAMR